MDAKTQALSRLLGLKVLQDRLVTLDLGIGTATEEGEILLRARHLVVQAKFSGPTRFDPSMTPEDAWNAALDAAAHYFRATRKLPDADLTFSEELDGLKT